MVDLDALLQGHRDAVNVRRIYGDPVESEGLTVIPAATIMGGTGGGGDAEGDGGGGFGLVGRPVGAWVIRDGEATWKPVVDVTRLAVLAFALGLAFALRPRRT
jgi:uncharacterized spore protein YtfJ